MLVPFTRSSFRLDRSPLGLDQVFSDLFSSDAPLARRPAVDLEQTDTGLVLTADLPGVRESDVDLSVHDDLLVLRAERVSETTVEPAASETDVSAADAEVSADDAAPAESPRRLLLEERSAARYERRLRLPKPIDADGVRAELRQGVLRVELPFAAHATPRKITVNAAG